MPQCVYALTSAAMPPISSITGIGRERLRTVRAGSITVIVGALRRAPGPDEATLRRFDRVVRQLFVAVPALLPVRFGTCFDTLDELTTVLRLRQASLRRAVRMVRGRAQMTVRVIAPHPEAGSRPASPRRQRTSRETGPAGPNGEGGRELAASRPVTGGADYLRRRAAQERHVPGFEPVRARVRRWVRDERVEHRAGVATIYHLVPRTAATSYRAAVTRAAAAAGLQCVVSGPWPPYAFADW